MTRRTVRLRWATAAVAAIAAVVAAAAAYRTTTSAHSSSAPLASTAPATAAPTTTTSSTAPPTTAAPTATTATPATGGTLTVVHQGECPAEQLRASETGGGSTMSQPYDVIALTNTGPTCTVDGYPGLAATGGPGFQYQGPGAPLSVAVMRGSSYERKDPGASAITLTTGASASFAVGTSAAQPQQALITSLAITPPDGYTQTTLAVHLAVSSAPGQPIDLIVTALVSGTAGPPQQ